MGKLFMEILNGTSGWNYNRWIGPFYPRGTTGDRMLSLYSRIFTAVEIDSTFYAIPSPETVKKWASVTPENFLFTAKIPKAITHENSFSGVEGIFNEFISVMSLLGKKLGCLLFQLPPTVSYRNSGDSFLKFIKNLPDKPAFSVEFRNGDWYNSVILEEMRKRNISVAWSDNPHTPAFHSCTARHIYLRLVGDRSISESSFGKVISDRSADMRRWSANLLDHRDDVDRAFVFANNHYAGFGPATARMFGELSGIKQVGWENMLSDAVKGKQTTLF